MRPRSRRRNIGDQPRPSIAEPRGHLLQAVLEFAKGARDHPAVHRVAIVGSLTTSKPIPKDADVLVTIASFDSFDTLAQAGRRLMGTTQRINLGADIFLADIDNRYLGRICIHRECHVRATCFALTCGRIQHLRDDLNEITLAYALIASPPIVLLPKTVRRCVVPADVEALLLEQLDQLAT